MRSLDLFTGYGGLTLALEPWCQPIAYVEIEEYAQKIIASRMADGSLPPAPILADVKNVQGRPGDCDIIVGGFPCQDISVAGNGKGLEGERSGLFFEVCRLVEEIHPSFVFLENVPAIRTRGLQEVIDSLTALRYDCRWTCVSAAEVGAPHLRKRWFLLAHTKQSDGRRGAFVGISDKQRRHTSKTWPKSIQPENSEESSGATELLCPVVANVNIKGLEVRQQGNAGEQSSVVGRDWWAVEPDVGELLPDGTTDGLGEIVNENVSFLWRSFGAKAIWQKVGRFFYLSKKEILLPFMYGEGSNEGIAIEVSDTEKANKIQEIIVRAMRISENTIGSPHRWKLEEQQYSEFEDALLCLSYIFASQTRRLGKKEVETALLYLWSGILSKEPMLDSLNEVKETWQSLDSAWKRSLFMSVWNVEPPIDRVAHGVTFRVDRIKALGNGVVPQQARAAFARLLFGLT